MGTCHAWLQAGGAPHGAEIVQECKLGLVRIRHDGTRLAFAAPKLGRQAPNPSQFAQVAAALGLQPQQIIAAQLLDNGPVWLGMLLDHPQTVLRLRPDHARLRALDQKVGVAARYPDGSADGVSLEVRAFAAPVGVDEDPVTGSLNASLAQWLIAEGRMPPHYVAAQGQCLARAGRVALDQDETGQVWVGGQSVTCIDGQVTLP